jgi:type I site-specific restriction-modification system R (restriction) subunit
MLFLFTEDKYINVAFDLIKEFNKNIESNNPIKAMVVPIEKYI